MGTDISRRRCIVATGALALGALAIASRAQPPERSIAVVARKFEFVPSHIRVKKGETVVLELTAPEVMMGFACADLQVRADIPPGRTTRLRITPERTGEFVFLCDVFCGSGHEEMSGTLIVTA
jgi:cytochrome c oxidase subunit 2